MSIADQIKIRDLQEKLADAIERIEKLEAKQGKRNAKKND